MTLQYNVNLYIGKVWNSYGCDTRMHMNIPCTESKAAVCTLPYRLEAEQV